MMLIRKRPCRHCHVFFLPDHRNGQRQKHCSKPECQRASKATSQARWLANNPNYFKGPVHVERVREWRRANPGRRSRKATSGVLQDDSQTEITQKSEVAKQLPPAGHPDQPVLQDICLAQPPVIIGLISYLLGCGLQDDIAMALRRLEQCGHDVLTGSTTTKGGYYDPQNPHPSRPHPHHPRTVQLAGSPSGP